MGSSPQRQHMSALLGPVACVFLLMVLVAYCMSEKAYMPKGDGPND